MTTPDTSWSEILINAGMEPELAKAFDLIELRTPDSRAVIDLAMVELPRVHDDLKSMKSTLESVSERMANLEAGHNDLIQLANEALLEMRALRRRFES